MLCIARGREFRDNATHRAGDKKIHDVAIIGYGPVGATLANILGAAGLDTVVIEREAGCYHLPRAVHFDDEVMRVFQSIGLAEAIAPHILPSPGMKFLGSDGALLLDWSRPQGLGVQGWHASYRFHQPALENTLRQGVARYPSVAVRAQTAVHAIAQTADAATLETSSGPIQARYVVGCDGANSLTRQTIAGTPGAASDDSFEDLGFDERWLVTDLILKHPRPDLGDHSIQHCDPARPATYVRGVGDRRRWEITLHDGEAPTDPWPLLARWITPEDATLERAAIYTFRSAVARKWRDGRLLIAGDAAHLTPPFMGQGMCAGIRDAANLGWKLAAVLRGEDAALLDTYQSERAPHARAYIETAVRLGGLINTRAMAPALGEAPAGPVKMESIAPALGGFTAPLGRPAPQPRLADGTLLDDRIGPRFAVLLRGDVAHTAALDGRGAVLVSDPALEPFLAANNALAALMRPDRQIIAFARTVHELATLF